MKRFPLFAAGIALFLVSTSAADVPPPPGIVQVTPRIRLAGVDKYPDQVFYVTLITRTNPNPSVKGTQLRFEVKNTEPVTLKGTQRVIGKMYVLALDRKDFEKRKAADETLAWLDEKAQGVLSASVTPPATFGNAKDKEVPVTEYQVNLADGKLSVQSPNPKAKAATSELAPEERPLRTWVFGIACALSLALFGVWFARRRPSA